MKKVVSICSARPNFVKLAAIHHALADAGCAHQIIHTGQHYDPLFSDVFFEQLAIPPPSHNLGVHGGDRDEVITRTSDMCERLLPSIEPDIVLVYGDVNGAVGAAQAASRARVVLGHVEAGLRSFDSSMPEEHNRIAIDKVADILFCTEQSGVDHLHREKAKGEVHLVGNTMIDTLVRMQPHIAKAEVPPLPFDFFAIVTMHRPSNVDSEESLQRNLRFLSEVSGHCNIVLPLHHRLQASLDKYDLHSHMPSSVHVIPPLSYIPFLALVEKSLFVMTDSGGLQEEATFLKKRCFTLRKNTERPSTIESGSNILIDIEKQGDRDVVLSYASDPEPAGVKIPPLWDGKAGKRIVEILRKKSQ